MRTLEQRCDDLELQHLDPDRVQGSGGGVTFKGGSSGLM